MKRVMVVDDEARIVSLVGEGLKRKGYDFLGATSGKEALCILETEKPDLILLDIMMPELDGWETLKLIREREDLRDVPVSMLTAKTLTPEVAGRDDIGELVNYIQKPFHMNVLMKKIGKIFEGLQGIEQNSGPEVDVTLITELKKILREEMLYENIQATLKGNIKRLHNPYEAELMMGALYLQEVKVNQLRSRKAEIESQIRAKHSTPLVTPDEGVNSGDAAV